MKQNILTNTPGRLGGRFRYGFYKKRFKSCGVDVSIPEHVYLKGVDNISIGDFVSFSIYNYIFAESHGSNIKLGDNTRININTMINANEGGSIIIGKDVLIGFNVVIRACGHNFDDVDIPIIKQGHKKGKISIGDNVWIGSNVVILPDVAIGYGAVVGAGSVVTKDVDDFDVVGGVPARKIRSRVVLRDV